MASYWACVQHYSGGEPLPDLIPQPVQVPGIEGTPPCTAMSR